MKRFSCHATYLYMDSLSYLKQLPPADQEWLLAFLDVYYAAAFNPDPAITKAQRKIDYRRKRAAQTDVVNQYENHSIMLCAAETERKNRCRFDASDYMQSIGGRGYEDQLIELIDIGYGV